MVCDLELIDVLEIQYQDFRVREVAFEVSDESRVVDLHSTKVTFSASRLPERVVSPILMRHVIGHSP